MAPEARNIYTAVKSPTNAGTIRIAMSEERRDGGWYYLADTAVRPV